MLVEVNLLIFRSVSSTFHKAHKHLDLIGFVCFSEFYSYFTFWCIFIFQTGEKLFELHGHTHKITAVTAFPSPSACEDEKHLILTASADRTVIVSFNLNSILLILKGVVSQAKPAGDCYGTIQRPSSELGPRCVIYCPWLAMASATKVINY